MDWPPKKISKLDEAAAGCLVVVATLAFLLALYALIMAILPAS